MAAKLSWEWADGAEHSIIVRKKKGRLSLDDIWDFMHTQEMLNAFEGSLVCWIFRPLRDRDSGWFGYEGDEGDAQELIIVQDETRCPICGRNDLFADYCPACGEKLKQPIDKMERLDGRR